MGTGWLALAAELRIDGEPAPFDYSLREITQAKTSVLGGPAMAMTLMQPKCLQFEGLDLVTGERSVHDSCHGDSVAEQFGALELDPTDELAAQCSGPAYVCEWWPGGGWDPSKCTTWPDGDPYMHPASPASDSSASDPSESDPAAGDESGCGCRTRTPSSPATLALLVWALVGLRRLRRRSG